MFAAINAGMRTKFVQCFKDLNNCPCYILVFQGQEIRTIRHSLPSHNKYRASCKTQETK